MKTDEAAIKIMKEQNITLIWYGNINLTDEVAELAGYKPQHPINRGSAVIRNIAKSKKFIRFGSIEHLGHRHPVYKIANEA